MSSIRKLLKLLPFCVSFTQPGTPQTCCKLWILPACCKLSTSCSKSVDFINLQKIWKSDLLQLIADLCRYLQTCRKLLKQLASSLWIRSLDNQLAASLLTTCSTLVIIKPEQAMRTHSDIGFMTARQQAYSRLAANCAFLAVHVSVSFTKLNVISGKF